MFFRDCLECPKNDSYCRNKDCILGLRRSIYTANRQFPGPLIQVCQNDILVVDVTNKIPGQEFAIHWRGQQQVGTQVMDGVPMITQCPISSYSTFQYKFRASTPGTHIWHAHSGTLAADGIFGALIVRQPNIIEPQKRLYDVDESINVVLITEMEQKSQFYRTIDTAPTSLTALLLNGKSNIEKQTILVKKGLRYRFRVAYAAGIKGCPIEIFVDNHNFKVIALDGYPVNTYEASKIIIGKGERIDFVLKANKQSGKYVLNINSACSLSVSAIIDYGMDDNNSSELLKEESYREFRTDICHTELGKICLGDVQSLFVMPSVLRSEKVNTMLYFSFNHVPVAAYGKLKKYYR